MGGATGMWHPRGRKGMGEGRSARTMMNRPAGTGAGARCGRSATGTAMSTHHIALTATAAAGAIEGGAKGGGGG